jgi:hypothetical protein
MGEAFVEEGLRMPHHIGHLVALGIVIESLDELHALPFLAVVVTFDAVMPAVALEEKEAVVIDRNAPITIKHLADPVLVPQEDNPNPGGDGRAKNQGLSSVAFHSSQSGRSS